jgi:hypothetical protein
LELRGKGRILKTEIANNKKSKLIHFGEKEDNYDARKGKYREDEILNPKSRPV